MRADYDTSANAISIAIIDAQTAEHSDEVHPRAIVALTAGSTCRGAVALSRHGDRGATCGSGRSLRPRP
jgi:hypothetical protein